METHKPVTSVNQMAGNPQLVTECGSGYSLTRRPELERRTWWVGRPIRHFLLRTFPLHVHYFSGEPSMHRET